MKTITMGRRRLKFVLAVALLATQFLLCNEACAQRKKYPYVMEGNIIVCREGNDGLKRIMIHPNWTETPSHNENEIVRNNFAAKFQWKVSDESDQDPARHNISRFCAKDGWRLATIRETILVAVLAKQHGLSPFASESVWATYISATIVQGGTSLDPTLVRWGVTTGVNRRIDVTRDATYREDGNGTPRADVGAVCIRDL